MPWRLERRLSSIQAIGLMETVCVHCSWPPRDPRGATEYQYGLWPDTWGTRLSHVASTRRHCLHLGRRWWSRVTCPRVPCVPLSLVHHGRVPRQPGALLARVGVEHRAGRLAGQQLGLADLLAAEGEVSCELVVCSCCYLTMCSRYIL